MCIGYPSRCFLFKLWWRRKLVADCVTHDGNVRVCNGMWGIEGFVSKDVPGVSAAS